MIKTYFSLVNSEFAFAAKFVKGQMTSKCFWNLVLYRNDLLSRSFDPMTIWIYKKKKTTLPLKSRQLYFFFHITVELIEDDRVQILQSLTSAEAEGNLFKQIVLTIYICGNIIFLVAFLAAINQVWNKKLRTLQWSTIQLKNMQGMLSIMFLSAHPWRCGWRATACLWGRTSVQINRMLESCKSFLQVLFLILSLCLSKEWSVFLIIIIINVVRIHRLRRVRRCTENTVLIVQVP